MGFDTGYLSEIQVGGAGEEYGVANQIFGHKKYADGLKVGRFAKIVNGELVNLDGTATPNVAGVVLRSPATSLEAGDEINKELTVGTIGTMLDGMVTVNVKAGAVAPAWGATVFASNAGDANDGLAQENNTDGVDTGAVFLQEIKAGVWLIKQK